MLPKIKFNAFEQFRHIHYADLSDIIAGRNTDEAMEVFRIFCSYLSKLQLSSLNLSDNEIGLRSAPIVSSALETQLQLKHLLLNNAGLQGDALKIIVDALLTTRENNTNNDDSKMLPLESIELYRNLLGSSGGETLVPLIKNAPSLRRLALSSSRIGEEGAYPLCVAIISLKNLQHLNLSDNSLGEEAAMILASGLFNPENSKYLEHVNLGDISCGEEGMTAILTALTSPAACPNLTYLDLQINELTNKQAKLLAKVIRHHLTLQTLIVENNELKSRSAIRCIRAFRRHPNVKELNFNENSLRSPVVDEIVEVFEVKKSLQMLKLNANQFRSESVDKLRAAFATPQDENDREKDAVILGSLSENDEEDDDEEEEPEEDETSEEDLPESPDAAVDNLATQFEKSL